MQSGPREKGRGTKSTSRLDKRMILMSAANYTPWSMKGSHHSMATLGVIASCLKGGGARETYEREGS